MSEPTCITKAREHCAKFSALHLDDTSAAFLYDSDGTTWRVSHLLSAYDAMNQRAEAAESYRDSYKELYEAWCDWGAGVILPLTHLGSDNVSQSSDCRDVIDARIKELTTRAEAAEAATKRAEHGIEVALNEHEACKVLLFRIEELKSERDALRKDAALLDRVQDTIDTMNRSGELSDDAYDKVYEVIPNERYMKWLTPKLDAALAVQPTTEGK